jgi:hypothetical protein
VVLHCLVVEAAIQAQQVRQVVAVVVVAQQEFCSTTLYCLLLPAEVVAVEAADSVADNRHLGQAARPILVCMQGKTAKITPVTEVVEVVAVEASPGVTVAQLDLVILAH